MFEENHRHKQRDIFDWESNLPKKVKSHMAIWETLRKEVYEKVDENSFSVLYPSHTGRPNSPINQLVTLLTIKELFDWTFRELEESMSLHIGLLHACSIPMGESTVSLRTITNFIQSLREYQDKTGVDLFNLEFNRLVQSQIESFMVNTKIARTDSTQIHTNVCAYNRLQLQIEAIKRLYRFVAVADQEYISGLNPNYIKYDADNYVSMLRTEEIKEEFQKVGQCYLSIIKHFGDKYAKKAAWQMFMRIFEEQFVVEPGDDDEPKISKKSSDDKTSNDIRAIDDPEATLRHKSGINNLGFVGNVVETSDPEAELNLICDVTLCPNNVFDGKMLLDSMDDLVKDRLTELEEIHYDGGYSGPTLDKKLEEYSINSVQTGIKGVKSEGRMFVEKCGDTIYVTCVGKQRVKCTRRAKSHKATFDYSVCKDCEHRNNCATKWLKTAKARVYYMRDNDLSKRLRLSYIKTVPDNRKTLRSGIEATMRQFKYRTRAEKSRLRGLYRHKLWFTLLALAINVKRINNYTTGVPKNRRKGRLSSCANVLALMLDCIVSTWDAFWQIHSTLWPNLCRYRFTLVLR
jgi:hypothetical protein